MRRLSLILALMPLPAIADDIPLSSKVTNVVLYPSGATITREVDFAAPAGAHNLILTDLPENTPMERVRVSLTGAQMGSLTTRRDYLPPMDPAQSDALKAAEAEIDRIEAEIDGLEAETRLIHTEAEAAEARAAFLQKLGESAAGMSIDDLRALSGLVGEETLNALRTAHAADQRIAAVEKQIDEAVEALEKAQAAKRALLPNESKARAMLSVAIAGEAAMEGTATITYVTGAAGWTPVYDMHLTRETGALMVRRGAFIGQNTGENWEDVALTLSTIRPSEQVDPGQVWPWLRRIYDPEQRNGVRISRSEGTMMMDEAAMAEPMMEAAAPMKARASADAISVSYTYPQPVSLVTDADGMRIELGEMATTAEVTAHAVPLSDPSAFLVAEFTNTSDELILPSNQANLYLDDRFVGQRFVDLIAAGDEAELSFGPIDGVRLSRVVKDRQEGDRGVISKSNELSEDVVIMVENLTGESWPVRVLDRVPYSEQEDLQIDWEANPMPSEETVDDKRGVLAWRFDLGAGETKEIRLSHQIEWPEGMMLQ